MKIKDISIFRGRNIYSYKPVIKILLDLEELNNKTTIDYTKFNDTLLALFPGLTLHYCGLGYEGGFVERLKEGTYFGHVMEHLAIELQNMIGYNLNYGKTRIQSEPNLYNVIFQYGNSNVAIECAKKSIYTIEKILNNENIDVSDIISGLLKIKNEYELGPSTQAIYYEAQKRGIPVIRLGSDSILQLGYGKYTRLVQASITDSTSCISIDIACNKQLAKEILIEHNIPVPHGDIAYTEEEAIDIAENIGYPVVLKPINGNQGKGVVLNISSEEDLIESFKIPQEFGSTILVEEFVQGKDYRILVVGDKVSAVSERTPPYVIGDGQHTIWELIDKENVNNLRGEDHEKPLTKIKIDKICINYLRKNSFDENTIPLCNQKVKLRDNGNLSTGGTARECIKEIHPYNADIAIKAVKAVGLDIAGVDIRTKDISLPINEFGGSVLEVNAAPGLRMHLNPVEGDSINVAADIIDFLYPDNSPSTIPIVAITGTNGKTTTARLIQHTISLLNKTVGMASTGGVFIDNECILEGDNTGPFSARTILRNKKVDAAVLEVARGGIIKRGLGYDLADVALITNISNDHVGQDGITSLEDLAYVKSLVIESVKATGHSILNADDDMVDYFLTRAQGNIILFSKDSANPLLVKHTANGSKAVFVRNNMIFIFDGYREISFINIRKIPITFYGSLNCNIKNSLGAIASLYALDIPLDTIRQGLLSFKPDYSMNPGRFNIFDMDNFKIMIDYAHNIGGYEEVSSFLQRISPKRAVGIIGIPGDRTDKDIIDIGNISAKMFSQIYIKEDQDLRGRKPGEVADIIYKSLLHNGFQTDDIKIIHSETRALESAMTNAQDGDMIVIFYEELKPIIKIINGAKFKNDNIKLNFVASVKVPSTNTNFLDEEILENSNETVEKIIEV